MSVSENNIIIIPDRFRDPYIFENVLSMQEEIFSENAVLDLSRVAFMEPYSMLSFLLIGRNYLRKSGEKLKLVNVPIHIQQYLTRMDFFESGIFNMPEVLKDNMMFKRNASSSRLLEITMIPNKERQSVNVISSVIALFRKRASLILKYWMSDSVTDYFVTVISELCQNIFEHSLDSGYMAMQTYRSGNENIARLVISDSGIGILKSFSGRDDLHYTGAAELIEMALTTPISSKREFGYGLCQVNSIVERLKGVVFIRSGESSLTALYDRKDKNSKHIFHRNGLVMFEGTQISISLSA
ncbi:MAG TPA: ATP-binding protein [Spirochaetota bacterium]|nr:ATP-binding protein [Spirochaetota bacterium]HPS85473.1 ATP-binding protein [Spirochaetota bacterium]